MLDQAPGWTDQRVAKLKDLWMRGFSASQIADELGGATRNAVLGKLSRMGMLQRKPHMSRPKERANRAEPIAVKKSSSQGWAKGNLRAEPDTAGMKLLATEVWNPLPGTNPVPLEQVTGCRWPLGDVRDGTFCMCNDPQVEGSSYCATHKRASEPRS